VIALVKRKPPAGLLRLLLRLPIWLFRAHLGWVLGSRFLLLTHRGRRSGLLRQIVVEVILHDPGSRTYFIASGWGEKSNWFRNVQRTPEVMIQVGTRRFAAMAQRLPLDSACQVLLAYAHCYPTAFRALTKMMIGRRLQGTQEACRTLAQVVPVVALRPQHGPRPEAQSTKR
jgi:deazaflavin-dependent oxidoreductase (nitroreductase family)